ncbi:MAG TPA: TolC family protein [Spirochaetota bacterium]
MSLFRIHIVALIIVILTGAGFAQTKPISLNECLSIALQNNPDIRLAAEEQNKSIADYQLVKATDRLQVGAVVNTAKEPNAAGKAVNLFDLFAGFTASYPLAHPGQGSREEIARKNLDISKITEKKTNDEIVLAVKTAYYGCISARKSTEVRDRIKKNFAVRLNATKGLVQTGDRPILDQSMAEVSLSQSNLEYQKAKNQEEVAKSELRVAMGVLSSDTPILTEDFPEMYQLKYGIDEIQNFINQYCYDVLTARVQTEIAKEGISVARAQHLPFADITGIWGKTYVGVDPKNIEYKGFSDRKRWETSMGVVFSAHISIFTGGAIAAQTDGAIADYNKALYNERKVLLKARKDAQNFVNRLNELRDQIEISRLNIENSRINLNLAQRSYDSGIGSQLVIQNAEGSLLEAEIGLIVAKQDYFTTMAQLSNLIGLEEKDLCGKK